MVMLLLLLLTVVVAAMAVMVALALLLSTVVVDGSGPGFPGWSYCTDEFACGHTKLRSTRLMSFLG